MNKFVMATCLAAPLALSAAPASAHHHHRGVSQPAPLIDFDMGLGVLGLLNFETSLSVGPSVVPGPYYASPCPQQMISGSRYDPKTGFFL
jgi:hypothetical protein